jgi:hypothetical protein
MQMTNYRAYLKGKASGTGSSRQELKLGAARRSGDPKKIAEASRGGGCHHPDPTSGGQRDLW